VTTKIEHIFFLDTMNSERYTGQFSNNFLKNLSDEENEYRFFYQTVQLPANNSMAAVHDVCGD
jgi:hypothetical protein